MDLALSLDRGQRIGRYEILRPLARGGMAELYIVRASGLPGVEKVLVLKRILPELARQPDFADMFLDEARIAATLHHQNIVHTYDVGSIDGNYFLAMEFLHGETVAAIESLLRQNGARMPVDVALQIAIDVAAGLHYAHEKLGSDGKPLEIVHRDVTPQNILVTYEGEVKLLDFGVAKAANRVQQTQHGTVKGKISYLSPEQCEAAPVDRRSDIFSLGVVLFEMTTGQRLFPGLNPIEIVRRIVDEPIPQPHTIDDKYPDVLERIVLRALDKRPRHRFATAAELRDELEGFARAEGMFLSASGLRRFMEELFASRIEAWRLAEQAGKSLEQHLQTIHFTIPLYTSDLMEFRPGRREERAAQAAPVVADDERQLTSSLPGPRRRTTEAPIGATVVGALVGAALAMSIVFLLAHLPPRARVSRPPAPIGLTETR